ncbi:MAG TPA: M23 family metallopeptidase [Candidatus Limnocylindrales bacterium]|nr:M23 family metallopeptidase [Candidatus Limnocylindrales bacterium]
MDLATGHPTSEPVSRVLTGARHEHRRPAAMARRRSVMRRSLVIHMTSERTVPLAVALVVLLAGVVSLGPGAVQSVGAAQAESQGPRLAIGGGVAGQLDPATMSDLAGVATTTGLADYVDDGTLYKPVAVDTSIQTATDLLRHYTVKSGDTLSTIAARFDVSVMTIWWANHLSDVTKLHVGQILVIPPVDGLVITVKVGDTLQSLATSYKVSPDAIVEANGLNDPNLIVGQVLLVPGAKGAPLPAVVKAKVSTTRTTSSRSYPRVTGWAWPVLAGGWYISQGFSSYHPALDVADKYGTPVGAPHAGRVIHAGWYQGGEGYTVWIELSNGMVTCEEHLSAIYVSVGQTVYGGQLIGRIGMSGNATGPHVHFEIWVGQPWMPGSYRVNPMRYY